MKACMTHPRSAACAIVVSLAVVAGETYAQQVPLSATPAEVPGPAPGTTMTKAYVQAVARVAYVWGWPLVNSHNRRAAFAKAPEPGRNGGVLPVAPTGRIAMLSDYMKPDQNFVTCTNQDVVYGAGYFALDKEPVVFQVPDFGDRFWVYALYDARTDEFAQIGKAYGTKPGFYLMVGPGWHAQTPAGITAVVRSSTELAFAAPRVFRDDTLEDLQAVQAVLNQINFYPLSEFDGTMKTKDWSKIPDFPAPKSSGDGEAKWVDPMTFFEQLPEVMKLVPPMPGEETLYNCAKWGTDYLNRTATAKSNMYENVPSETKYVYTDYDSAGKPLHGRHRYTITFPKGQLPPVKGFWSLTLYNEHHFFHPNPLNRYSLGTKSKSLQPNADGSLTLYVGAKSPGNARERNWLPAPNGPFSLYIRAYWADPAILDGTWKPPAVSSIP